MMKPPVAVYCQRCKEVVNLNHESRCVRCDDEIDPEHPPTTITISANLEGKVSTEWS